MCGICGELAFGDAATSVSEARTRRMADTLRHRGPDAGDVYVSPPVALGHRRLSIIDVKTGRQPISNEDGTIWVVYNGEIYNYRELTGALEAKGHRFRTASDTEVIVHLYEELGERCVVELQGMFSFALWDGRRRVLFLARDRVGIKPLYYARTRDGLQSLVGVPPCVERRPRFRRAPCSPARIQQPAAGIRDDRVPELARRFAVEQRARRTARSERCVPQTREPQREGQHVGRGPRACAFLAPHGIGAGNDLAREAIVGRNDSGAGGQCRGRR